jgi:hypothetical protein
MNNKELATGVLKHPLIQEILKRKLAESSVVNRLIVEEIMMEDELDEAKSAIKKGTLAWNALQGIKRDLQKAKKADKLDAFVKKYEGPLEKGDIPYGKWSEITDKTEREQILSFARDSLVSIKGAGQPPASPGQMASFIKSINQVPKSYERILQNSENSDEFGLTDDQKEILKQTFDKTQSSSTAEIAGNISTAADLIALGLLATGVGTPAAFVAKATGVVASIVEAVTQYNAGKQKEAVVALLGIIPITKLPFAKKFAGKILGSLAKSPVAAEALELAIKESIKKLSSSEEEAKDKLEGEFGSGEESEEESTGTNDKNAEMDDEEAGTTIDPADVTTTGGDDEKENPVEKPVVSTEEVEDVVDETIEVAQEDFDKSQVEKVEVDKGILDTMDIFFGQNEEEGKYSFLHRAFLSDQADMLWTLVSDLNKIINPQGDKELAIRENVLDTIKDTGDKIKSAFSKDENEEEVQLDKKERLPLKRELAAFADLLREVKRLAGAYKQYATQSGSDPRYDGSRLKKALMGSGEGDFGLLGEVQKHCAILAKEIARIKQEQLSSLDEAKETGDEKRVRRQTVIDTYNQMGTMYLNSIRPALKGELDDETDTAEVNQTKAQETAQEMLDMITKDPNIAKYFPKALVSNTTGKVVTIDQAIIALDAEVKAFGKVLRDIYRLAKGESVTGGDVSRMGAVLISLAETLESSFNVPSMVSNKTKKQLEKDTPEDLLPLGEEPKAPASEFPDVAEIARRIKEDPEMKDASEATMIDNIIAQVEKEVPKDKQPETEALEVIVQQEMEKIITPEKTQPTKLGETEAWQNLDKLQKEAIKEFYKWYNEYTRITTVAEGTEKAKRKMPKSIKDLDSETKEIILKFGKDLNFTKNPDSIHKILKFMSEENRFLFVELLKNKDPIIEEILNFLARGTYFSGGPSRKPKKRRPRNTPPRVGLYREQELIEKLKPIIEKIFKEQ